MNNLPLVSTDGNKVTFSTGFNDVPKHHTSNKRKATINSYTSQEKSEFSFIHRTSLLSRRVARNESLRFVNHTVKQLYTVMEVSRLIDTLFRMQTSE